LHHVAVISLKGTLVASNSGNEWIARLHDPTPEAAAAPGHRLELLERAFPRSPPRASSQQA
jgi:hypothetical protein